MSQLNLFLYWLVITAVIAGESLLICWATTSSRPRLVCALAVWTTVVLLMAIEAYLPALLFTMTAVFAWAIVAGAQRWCGPRQTGWRFELADLFIVVLFVATIIAIFRQAGMPYRVALFLPILGAPLAPVIAFAHLSVAGPARPRMVVATLLAILVSAATLLGMNIGQGMQIGWLIRMSWANRDGEIVMHLVLLACLIACVALLVGLGLKLRGGVPTRWQRIAYVIALGIVAGILILLVARYVDELIVEATPQLAQRLLVMAVICLPLVGLAALIALQTWLARIDWSSVSHSRRRAARGLAWGAAAIVGVPAAWLYWQMLWPTPFPPPPAGEPNHYERIVAICKEMHAITKTNYGGFSTLPPEFKVLAEEVVCLLQAPNFTPTIALEAESRHRLDSKYVLIGHDMRVITNYLQMEADVLQRQGDYDAAADYTLAHMGFYEMLGRGGTPRLASRSGYEPLLARHRNAVSIAKAGEIVAALEQMLAGREPLEVLVARQFVQTERSQGWQSKLRFVLATNRTNPDMMKQARDDYFRSELSLHSLRILYAVRLYEDQHRRLPSELAELTPDCMSQVPLDPYSQQPLVYEPSGSTYELYSVGPNGIDEGGQGDDVDLSLADYQSTPE